MYSNLSRAALCAALLGVAAIGCDTLLTEAPDDGDILDGPLGVNFRPTPDTALKLDYVRGREWDRFDSAAETAALLFSLATYV